MEAFKIRIYKCPGCKNKFAPISDLKLTIVCPSCGEYNLDPIEERRIEPNGTYIDYAGYVESCLLRGGRPMAYKMWIQ